MIAVINVLNSTRLFVSEVLLDATIAVLDIIMATLVVKDLGTLWTGVASHAIDWASHRKLHVHIDIVVVS